MLVEWEGHQCAARDASRQKDTLVIEIVMKFIVEPLNILERRNDLLQIVVLKLRVSVKTHDEWTPQVVDQRPHLFLAENWIIHLEDQDHEHRKFRWRRVCAPLSHQQNHLH